MGRKISTNKNIKTTTKKITLFSKVFLYQATQNQLNKENFKEKHHTKLVTQKNITKKQKKHDEKIVHNTKHHIKKKCNLAIKQKTTEL